MESNQAEQQQNNNNENRLSESATPLNNNIQIIVIPEGEEKGGHKTYLKK